MSCRFGNISRLHQKNIKVLLHYFTKCTCFQLIEVVTLKVEITIYLHADFKIKKVKAGSKSLDYERDCSLP